MKPALIDVAEARKMILDRAPLLPPESLTLSEALGRVLFQAAHADRDSPPFDTSAMDGYAIRCDDPEQYPRLEVVAEIQAGGGGEVVLQAGQCARIFTGGRVPQGAERVLVQEEAELEGGRLKAPQEMGEMGSMREREGLQPMLPIPPTHIRRQGENCRSGATVVPAGRRLRPVDLAALASCGVTQPTVSRRPRVVHFVTGNELVSPSQTPTGTEIRDSNSILIASLLTQHGAELIHHAHLPDSPSLAPLETLPDFDLLLISGGASVGDYDYARPILEQSGFRVEFHGVNLKPGKPLLFATRGRQLAFAIPGNPVSHAVIFQLFLAPLLAAMQGDRAGAQVVLLRGQIDSEFPHAPNPRETYWPCIASWRDAGYSLAPVAVQSSGDILGTAGTNALARIPSRSVIKQGDFVEFLWFQS